MEWTNGSGAIMIKKNGAGNEETRVPSITCPPTNICSITSQILASAFVINSTTMMLAMRLVWKTMEEERALVDCRPRLALLEFSLRSRVKLSYIIDSPTH